MGRGWGREVVHLIGEIQGAAHVDTPILFTSIDLTEFNARVEVPLVEGHLSRQLQWMHLSKSHTQY